MSGWIRVGADGRLEASPEALERLSEGVFTLLSVPARLLLAVSREDPSAPPARALLAGDLAAEDTPWLGWGPYLWADGLEAREDGLDWACGDFVAGGTQLSSSGEEKAAGPLLDFFRDSPFAAPWTRP